MFSKKLFAQRVQEIRKSHHETQKELGEIISTRATNISEIESGRKTTTTEKLALICRHYHVSADYLLGLSDDMQGGIYSWTDEE